MGLLMDSMDAHIGFGLTLETFIGLGLPLWASIVVDHANLYFLADEKYHYSSIEKGWLFSSVSVGALLGTFAMFKIFPMLGTR